MLTTEVIKEWISDLAQSQGFYDRLYMNIEQTDSWDDFTAYINNSKIDNIVDFVMFLEG